uniref:NAD-dependent epimerase/dehydratase family protein n=1 Tax=Planktothricoides sp. SpSt-374 TaxID=2282167 RepID=A0A7C3ZXR8_9CYAN
MSFILVTGNTGFIGKHTTTKLRKLGFRLSCASRHHFPNISNSINHVISNIDGNTHWYDALKNIDAVIHLAARAHILNDTNPNPEAEFFAVNSEGTANLVKQSIQAGVKHFIFISSIGAMASLSNQPLQENSPCQPDTPYGRSKLAAEQALISLASESDMTWTILRPTLVYGPGNPGNMERLIKLVKKGLPLPFGQVNNSRSLVYVGNLVDAIITCLTHPNAKNQTFLISDGEDLSTPDLIRKIAYHLDCPCNLLPVPPSLLRVAGNLGDMGEKLLGRSLPLNTPTIDRLLGSLVVDSSKIRNTLNWQPPFTIDEGLQKTLRL